MIEHYCAEVAQCLSVCDLVKQTNNQMVGLCICELEVDVKSLCFALWTGELDEVSPCLQRREAESTLIYGGMEEMEDMKSVGCGDVSPTIISGLSHSTGRSEISNTYVYKKTEGCETYGLVTNTGFAQGDAVTTEVSGTLGIKHQNGVFHEGCDVFNGQITGEVAASVTTASGIGNGTGPKCICFEPGIAGRDCQDNRFVSECCTTIRAKAGDNQQAVCFRPGITTRLGRPMERTGVSGTLGRTSGDNTEHVMIYHTADAVRMMAGKPGGGKGPLVSEDTSLTLATGNDQSVFCYNDQGGGAMHAVEDGNSPTLRSETKHHEPLVYGCDITGGCISEDVMGTLAKNVGVSANRCGGGSVLEAIAIDGDKINKAERKGGSGIGYNESGAGYTLTEADRHAVAYSKTCRPKEPGGCPTFKETGVANTLNIFDNGEVRTNELACEVYTVDSEASNSMKSSNPHSGIHKADVGLTLDTTTPTPQKHQGGQMVTVFDNHANDSRVTEAKTGAVQSITTRAGTGGGNLPFVAKTGVVRRLTPLECERLMGFPTVDVLEIGKMTKDEFIAWEIASGNIKVDVENGIVYTCRTGGGNKCEPRVLEGTELNGYKVVSLREKKVKMQCRIHRIVWIAKNGIIPDGYVIDHINNNKTDNRISNLQLLTPEQNSHKAKEDGLYLCDEDNPASKLSQEEKIEVVTLYETGRYAMQKLADMFGVSKSRVSQLVRQYGYTQIPWKGKPADECPDSPRYAACGNSMCVNVMRWIGMRIQQYVDSHKDQEEAKG